jgi:hypothetical protein
MAGPWTVDGDSFTTRHKIRIPASKVNDVLTDASIFFDLSLLDARWWANVKNGGGDIRITDSDGSTRLALDAVTCDTATSEGELHFKDPSTSSTVDNDYYIYCGNAALSQPAPSSTYGSENAYDSSHVVVYHLEDYNDSTSSGFDLSVPGGAGAPANTTGKLGGSPSGGYTFVITESDNLQKSDEISLRLAGDSTHEIWFKTTSTSGGTEYIYCKGDGANNGNYYFLFSGGNFIGGCISITDPVYVNVSAGLGFDDSNWHMAQMTFIGTTVELWVDGVSIGTDTDVTQNDVGTEPFSLGADITSTNEFDGDLDEVKTYNVGGSDAELAFRWLNQNDPSTFFTVSASEGADSFVAKTTWFL